MHERDRTSVLEQANVKHVETWLVLLPSSSKHMHNHNQRRAERTSTNIFSTGTPVILIVSRTVVFVGCAHGCLAEYGIATRPSGAFVLALCKGIVDDTGKV